MADQVKHEAKASAKRTKVSRKHQVTLPVAVLAAAHIEAGDTVEIQVEGDGVVKLVREKQDPWLDLLEKFEGSAPGLAEATNLEELRDEWER